MRFDLKENNNNQTDPVEYHEGKTAFRYSDKIVVDHRKIKRRKEKEKILDSVGDITKLASKKPTEVKSAACCQFTCYEHSLNLQAVNDPGPWACAALHYPV